MSEERKPHGMLFTGPMITALLNTKPDVWPAEAIDAGLPFKFQTRRGIKLPKWSDGPLEPDPHIKGVAIAIARETGCFADVPCPHPVGQIIYARETFMMVSKEEPLFRADYGNGRHISPWKPGIHMPKAAARLWFEVKRVRVERVNAISEADAKAEGIRKSLAVEMKDGSPCYTIPYRGLFDYINGSGAFDRGDWVWVYDIARISKPKDIV